MSIEFYVLGTGPTGTTFGKVIGLAQRKRKPRKRHCRIPGEQAIQYITKPKRF